LRLKLAEALVASGEAETALADIRATADRRSDPRAWLLAGRVEDLLDRPAEAEAALRRALAIAPNLVPALLALADLLERDNRIDAFAETLATLDSVGVPRAETALLHARLLLRRGEFDRALEMARAAPDSLDPGTKAKLIGEICDRLGDVDAAFTAFTEMNRLTAREQAGADRMAASYRVRVAALGQMTTEQWYGGWSAARPAANRAAPAFLFGFPRSGTTLLDTMLMGHPDSVVMEETPVLETLSESFGDQSGLPPLDQPAIEALRRDYFRIADSHAPEAAGAGLLVDKVPLGLTLTPLVHRIFPDARFIFVERHPADVVLSCYMTRFSPRDGTANFLGLEDTAELYDLIMDYWRRCRAVLPLAVHTVRYESMIDDAEGELRALAAFLDLAWDPALLDHRRSASKRAYIATPSYAQVSEPLYTRARGRWKRYRRQLEPVLPILAPWATEMGYDI
jgi:tetratricopeptide (TPR) repeat protein